MLIDYRSMGMRIRRRRKDLNMTQAHLAEMTNLSSTYVGHLERGTKIPSIQTLVDICYALEVSLDYLFEDTLPEVCIRDSSYIFRQPVDGALCNTLSDWLFGEPCDFEDDWDGDCEEANPFPGYALSSAEEENSPYTFH